MQATRVFLTRILQDREILKTLNIQSYKTIIRLITTFGCEVWTIGTVEQNQLHKRERKVVRRKYGEKYIKGI